MRYSVLELRQQSERYYVREHLPGECDNVKVMTCSLSFYPAIRIVQGIDGLIMCCNSML